MAPVLSALWGPEVAGSGVARTTLLGGEQLVLVGTLTAISAFVLLSLLLLLCASCQGQKKANVHPGDHENLMNGVSDRETFSQSVDSPGTDQVVSSYDNGPLTSGTVLTDTQDTSPHLSEEMLSSQSELRSSKCPQDRELPSIPPNSALEGMGGPGAGPGGDGPPASGDGTYEMVKESGVAASRDVSMEDSLYETVKELKSPPHPAGLTNGTSSPLSPEEEDLHPSPHPLHPPPHPPPPATPSTPDRGPLCEGVEYASVDLNKKSRYSADLEARRSASMALSPSREEPEEEEKPPPVPDKVLDENDNQPLVLDGMVGTGLHNGELHSPLSLSLGRDNHILPLSPGLADHILSENELSAVYSLVGLPCGGAEVEAEEEEEEKESDYSSIAELNGLVPESTSCNLYATVRDIYPQPDPPQPGDDGAAPDNSDPGYETIRIPKTGSREGQAGLGSEVTEPDYESVGELGLNRESSRL